MSKKITLLDTPAAHFDAGFCNGLLMLRSHIIDNEKITANMQRILNTIEQLVGDTNENSNDNSR
jgi:hypothetical protein